MKLILVRHGETEWNAERRLQGHADAPLSARGLEQARGTSLFFAGSPAPVHVVSSDLTRPAARPKSWAFPMRRPMRASGRWIWANGPAAGSTTSRRRMPRPIVTGGWELIRHPAAKAGGASARASNSALTEISRRHGGDVVVVTHEGVVRAACQILIGLTPECMARVSPAALTILTVDHAAQGRTAQLVAYNFAPTPGDLRTRGLDHVAV